MAPSPTRASAIGKVADHERKTSRSKKLLGGPQLSLGTLCSRLKHEQLSKIDAHRFDSRRKELPEWIDPCHPLVATRKNLDQGQGQTHATRAWLSTDLHNPRTGKSLNEIVEDLYPRRPAATTDPLASLQQANLLPQRLERRSVAWIQVLPSYLNISSW
jgi:hypothetical protein